MNIVNLDSRRKAVKPSPVKLPELPRYVCVGCDWDEFRIYANGSVHCTSCGLMLRNVRAYEEVKP